MGVDDRQKLEPWAARIGQLSSATSRLKVRNGASKQAEISSGRIVLEGDLQDGISRGIDWYSGDEVLSTAFRQYPLS